MAPRPNTKTYSTKGMGRASRDVKRLPDPGSGSEDEPEPEPQPSSIADEESNDVTPPQYGTTPCIPCLRRMVKVPSKGHPEPCILPATQRSKACPQCHGRRDRCDSPARSVELFLKEWDNKERRDRMADFTEVAENLQDAAKLKLLEGQQLPKKWADWVKEAQRYIDDVDEGKAKQEAHNEKVKYDDMSAKIKLLEAQMSSVNDWIAKNAETLISRDEKDEMFVRFLACAMLLEKADRDKFQKTLDHIRGVSDAGDDGTDDDTVDEEEDEEQESLSGEHVDDVSMGSE
ncbi:hypothetical protein FDENT_11739 [Fusarium denticulatum]|uniref:Uncharacterized protein n=1 Tax=Fusarium denticulatum TaxID=48507 RepID=A0A8H5WQQ9_9HYPO|nr:hypothetical protein FDENT_11739 [Fusarium denticulatum]